MYCQMMPQYQPQCHAMAWGQPSRKDQDALETLSKLLKMIKKEEKKEKKPSAPKGDPFMLFIFLTAISPLIGSGGVYIMSILLRMTFENLQAIVH